MHERRGRNILATMIRLSLLTALCSILALANPVGAVQKFTPTRRLRWTDLDLLRDFNFERDEDDMEERGTLSFLQQLWSKGQKHGVSALGGVRCSMFLRGGSMPPLNRLDSMARPYLLASGWLVSLQALGALAFSRRSNLYELASRMMSRETVQAVKTIRTILESVDDHGVIDIFRKYKPQQIIGSIYALARLQTACEAYETAKSINRSSSKTMNPDLLQDLVRYAPFASAAYGWKLDLATAGRLHRGDLMALTKMTGVDEEDVINVNWDSRPNRPAFFLVRDRSRRRIVLSIRGTWSAHDVLTDLCCTTEEYFTQRKRRRAHSGMLTAARGVQSLAEDIIANELKDNPDYSLLLVGHSMGGSVAAILGQIWSKKFRNPVVYAYGPACVCPENEMAGDKVVSVILEGDPFATLSLGHVADVSFALDKLCKKEDLRTTILMRTDGPPESFDERDLLWCHEQMERIRGRRPGGRLYPPGKLVFIGRSSTSKDPATITEVPPSFFKELKISHRMFDLSRHVPRLYQERLESALSSTE